MSNVVPFPRDWLGPRDELVPFGREAVDKPDAEADAADVHEISLAPPPGPDAFWGEESAEIHAVLQGPGVGTRDVVAEPQPPSETKNRPFRVLALLAVGLLAAVTAVAAAIIGIGGKSSPPTAAISNAVLGSLSAEHGRIARLQMSLEAAAASDSRNQRDVQKHGAANPGRRRPGHRPAHKIHHVTAVRASSSTYAVTTQPVSSSSSTVSAASATPTPSSASSQPVDVPSSSSTGSVVSAPTQPTSSSTTSAGGATSSHSGGQSSKAKAPAGPTGNSALLGPGHCNC